jgi:NAD(P)H-dependent flavin oxidoreductase YrpB (nitropropane dioxygenase family)
MGAVDADVHLRGMGAQDLVTALADRLQLPAPRNCWHLGEAAGVLLGTRFQVALEALVDPSVTKAITEAGEEDTERSRLSDIARGAPWPARYSARTLRNPFLDRWHGKEESSDLVDTLAAQAEEALARAGGR